MRREVFQTFAREGRAPSPAELATTLRATRDAVLESLRELHDAHALVLTTAGDAIRMAHPFSAWPMNFVVRKGECMWWGGCAWDSFGIVAALDEDLEILTTCPACGAELRYSSGPRRAPSARDVVVRLPRPAREWWDDVVQTCTSIRAFCSREHARRWIDETGVPEGAIVELEHMWRLALPWYGDRLDRDWSPQTAEHRQRLLENAGLTGGFWALPS